MIVAGLFWVTMPYLLRDQISWSTRSPERRRFVSGLGFVFGAAILSAPLSPIEPDSRYPRRRARRFSSPTFSHTARRFKLLREAFPVRTSSRSWVTSISFRLRSWAGTRTPRARSSTAPGQPFHPRRRSHRSESWNISPAFSRSSVYLFDSR
jgi:hypothetical protein